MKFTRLRESCRRLQPLLLHLKADKKKAAVLLLCVLAVVLLLLSERPSGSAQEESDVPLPSAESYAQALETRLTKLLSAIDGAGRTQVLITLRSGTETVFARDDRLDAAEEHTQSEQTYVTLRDGSRDTGLALKTVPPQILGVAVVCDGADDPAVRRAVTQTVTAALGVGASHVSVVKMQAERN